MSVINSQNMTANDGMPDINIAGKDGTPLIRVMGKDGTPLARVMGKDGTPLAQSKGEDAVSEVGIMGKDGTPLARIMGKDGTPLVRALGKDGTPLAQSIEEGQGSPGTQSEVSPDEGQFQALTVRSEVRPDEGQFQALTVRSEVRPTDWAYQALSVPDIQPADWAYQALAQNVEKDQGVFEKPSTDYLSEVKVSMTNLSPEQGQVLSPLWFALHDGSYDAFNEGEKASAAIAVLAEDGIAGDAQGRLLPEVMQIIAESGADLSQFPAPENTLAGRFAASDAAANGGYQDLLTNNRLEAPLVHQLPGETTSVTFTPENFSAATQGYLSYASMPFPTNDGFFGNDNPREVGLFDGQGTFIGANFIVNGDDMWDAGTEVNDETLESLPLDLRQLFVGTPENGVVQKHPGLKAPGEGGAVDIEIDGVKIFENADFSAPSYQLAQIEVAGVYEGDYRRNTITGTLGSDEIDGKGGKDYLYGDPELVGALTVDQDIPLGGEDTIYGGWGSDHIYGGYGNDMLYGEGGRDYLYGEEGDDLLNGGVGGDVYAGGAGADTFVLSKGYGFDVVEDFQVGTDYLQLSDDVSYGALELKQQGSQAVVSLGHDRLAVLQGVDVTQLGADSFLTVSAEMA